MKKHKWWHFITTHTQEATSKKTLLDPQRTIIHHYEVNVEKCGICNMWKVRVIDYKKVVEYIRPWEPKLEAIQWLKDNDYGDVL